MSFRVATVYPDYIGAATAAGFDRAIVNVVPEAICVAVLHAPAGHAWSAQNAAAAYKRTRIVITPAGVNAAARRLAPAVTVAVVGRAHPAESDLSHLGAVLASLRETEVAVADHRPRRPARTCCRAPTRVAAAVVRSFPVVPGTSLRPARIAADPDVSSATAAPLGVPVAGVLVADADHRVTIHGRWPQFE
jgi:hypothetical protein